MKKGTLSEKHGGGRGTQSRFPVSGKHTKKNSYFLCPSAKVGELPSGDWKDCSLREKKKSPLYMGKRNERDERRTKQQKDTERFLQKNWKEGGPTKKELFEEKGRTKEGRKH